jgi:hypothetical protein
MTSRFRFRLRTLLIVVTLLAVPCAYLGWPARIVAERRAELKRILDSGGDALVLSAIQAKQLHRAGQPREIPFVQWLLGDEYVQWIARPRDSASEYLRVTQEFPEADVLFKN